MNEWTEGQNIVADVRTRTGKVQKISGEVVRIYRKADGEVSFVTVITGQSANRSKRYIDRHNLVAVR